MWSEKQCSRLKYGVDLVRWFAHAPKVPLLVLSFTWDSEQASATPRMTIQTYCIQSLGKNKFWFVKLEDFIWLISAIY